MMHTCFKIISNEGTRTCFNMVGSDFPSAVGEKLFSKIRVFYVGGESEDLTAKHELTDFNGSECRMGFCCDAPAREGKSVCGFAFISSGGKQINEGALEVPFELGKGCRVEAEVYMAINGSPLLFAEDAGVFFEWLAGVRQPSFTYAVCDCPLADNAVKKKKAEAVRENDGVYVIFGDEREEGAYVAFFADNRHIFSLAATDFDVFGEIISPTEGDLPVAQLGCEINEVAGGAVAVTDVAVRPFGVSVGSAEELVGFSRGEERVELSDSGRYVCFLSCGIVSVFDRGRGGRQIYAFNSLLHGALDACFFGEKLLVLKDKMYEVDLMSGSAAEHAFDGVFSRIFASDKFIILCGESQIVAFNADYSQIYTKTATALGFSFDKITNTLTAVLDGNVLQLSVNDGGAEELTVSADIPNSATLNGRYGTVVWEENGTVKFLNVFSGKKRSLYLSPGSRPAQGGRLIASPISGGTAVYNDRGQRLYTIKEKGLPFEQGFVSNGRFYPFTAKMQYFEVMKEDVSDEYSVYGKVPYFAQKQRKITFGGILNV